VVQINGVWCTFSGLSNMNIQVETSFLIVCGSDLFQFVYATGEGGSRGYPFCIVL